MTSIHLHVDAVGGLAGDMFVAALLDLLSAEVDDGLVAQLRSAGVADDVVVASRPHHDGVLQGRRFHVDDPRERQTPSRLLGAATFKHR
jgi:pyridinium-3,5-bisthiocarboxylic acid mononucleotide nickel chelatase